MRQTAAMRSHRATEPAEPREGRVVYAALPFWLARVEARVGATWRVVTTDGRRVEVAADASVDPTLLDDAVQSGARVLVEIGPTPVIVGVMLIARPLSIDRDGVVEADVERFTVTARDSATIQTRSAFVRVKAREVELYGEKVLTRARNLVKLAAAMIRLN